MEGVLFFFLKLGLGEGLTMTSPCGGRGVTSIKIVSRLASCIILRLANNKRKSKARAATDISVIR